MPALLRKVRELSERRIERSDGRHGAVEALDLDEGKLSSTALGKPRRAGIAS